MKTSKEKMIEVIYEKIANKERSFRCNILYKHFYWMSRKSFKFKRAEVIKKISDYNSIIYFNKKEFKVSNMSFYMVWYQVLIWDVLDYIENYEVKQFNSSRASKYVIFNSCSGMVKDTIITDWKNKRLPIEKQNIECIEYIYNLIKD